MDANILLESYKRDHGMSYSLWIYVQNEYPSGFRYVEAHLYDYAVRALAGYDAHIIEEFVSDVKRITLSRIELLAKDSDGDILAEARRRFLKLDSSISENTNVDYRTIKTHVAPVGILDVDVAHTVANWFIEYFPNTCEKWKNSNLSNEDWAILGAQCLDFVKLVVRSSSKNGVYTSSGVADHIITLLQINTEGL